MTTTRLAALLFLAALPCACRAPRASRVCGRVVDDLDAPVAGARIRPSAGDAARSDADGFFCTTIRGTEATLAAAAAGTCPGEPVPVAAGGFVTLPLARQLVAAPARRVGFDAEVVLRAALRCPLPGPHSFHWRQLAGPPLGDRAAGWDSPALRLRTHPLGARTTRPDVLSLSPAEAGHYRFRVTARGGGEELSLETDVTAASVLSGLLSVPLDTDVYVDAGTARPGGGWELLTSPPGSHAVLRDVPTVDGAGGVARLRLDRTGLYELRETLGGQRLLFEAGPWDLVPRDCDRPECHPAEQVAWAETRHARALRDRLDAPSPREPFAGRCLACHTVGWDPAARAGGFDDVADETGVRVRDGWPGGAGALPRDLRRLADVWCIACHGPGRLPEHGKRPMIVRAGVCAQCHDAPPEYPHAGEWRESRMARPLDDPARLGERCAGCHTAQGAVTRLRGRIVVAVDPGMAEPVTCAVCHVAHTGEPSLLRATGTAATVSGVLFEAGAGAVCIGCHQANARADRAAEAARRLPEAPQTEVLFGTGAFLAAGRPESPTPDLCVDCHMTRCLDCHDDERRRRGGHTFRAMPVRDAAPHDCDGDGVAAPLDEEIDACLARLGRLVAARLESLDGCAGARLGRAGQRLEPLGPDAAPLPACRAAWMRPEQATLYRAAHDLALIDRDGSHGAHNPDFAVRVLRAAIESLTGEP